MNFLHEKHNLRTGDEVIVYRREYPDEIFEGKIYKIEFKKINDNYVNHFYIEFPLEIYHELLKRGSNIYYDNSLQTVGTIIRNKTTDKIEKIHTQHMFQEYEPEIDLQRVNAMLIWRIAYNIIKK